jgi:hypothetical protein
MSAHRDDSRTVLHWYDFICPFCYVGQQRQRNLHILPSKPWMRRDDPMPRKQRIIKT